VLELLTEDVITNEEDEVLLKAAALHANLLLDCDEVSKTVKLFFRLDLPFSTQNYFSRLSSLDFETLIELMNAKVEQTNSTIAK